MQFTTVIPLINIPPSYSPEIDSLMRYEKEMTHIVEGKIRPDLHRDIVRTFNDIHPFLIHNAKFRGKNLPQQENAILLKTEALINYIRSLGKPVPEKLFEIQARYKVRSGCDHSSFKQKQKDVEELICEHYSDMELLKNSKSKFNAKRPQIEARAKTILERLGALISEVRPKTTLAKQLSKIKQLIGSDLLNIIDRRNASFLCSPSPLTTAVPSLEGTRTLNATDVSADSA